MEMRFFDVAQRNLNRERESSEINTLVVEQPLTTLQSHCPENGDVN